MNSLLEQFLSEARDFLQGIAQKLMQLEQDPTSTPLMTELFRFVHTLKGNSGLFDFPEMTRVLHASEDLMDAVRNGHVAYSQTLADQLLEAMDFVGMLMDEIEATEKIGSHHVSTSAELSKSLRDLLTASTSSSDVVEKQTEEAQEENETISENAIEWSELPALDLPESIASELHRLVMAGETVFWVEYIPEPECFFKGEDPFYLARQIPDSFWQNVAFHDTVPSALEEMDVYNSVLVFQVLTIASEAQLDDLFRYVPDQVRHVAIPSLAFVKPSGNMDEYAIDSDVIDNHLALLDKGDTAALVRTIETMLELSAPDLWSSSVLRWILQLIELDPSNTTVQKALLESLRTLTPPDWAVLAYVPQPTHDAGEAIQSTDVNFSDSSLQYFSLIVNAQREVLSLPANACGVWNAGRLKSIAASLKGCYQAVERVQEIETLEKALQDALAITSPEPLLKWLEFSLVSTPKLAIVDAPTVVESNNVNSTVAAQPEVKFGRRAEDSNATAASKTLKVDQDKIDRLMNLIGEMVVAKNALPYLANRAETVFGVRELAREIKAQYAVINRVAEEMQDTIMQVRMMPVSFIFQRFPRMVRDISRKLGKEVELVLEGETTEADKNIIESLSDPLIHIVRNSLDHGLEQPDVRLTAGKPAAGKLLIRASQESDKVLIEIIDDGKGINPDVIKHKAYEKGLIDEATLERISDQEAVNLVFAAGFSTADVISDLSGRGVGMDVVRSAIERVNGTVGIESEVGKGTRIYLSLPLSMAVTNVMIIESDKQIFGVPMDMVVETVRVPRAQLRTIKQKQTTVLRGRIVPLLSLNDLLARNVEQLPNEDDEFATLIVRVHGEHVGILVDDFRETVDIILKPMTGILGGLSGYSGAALLGDGSVLMVLNPRELI